MSTQPEVVIGHGIEERFAELNKISRLKPGEAKAPYNGYARLNSKAFAFSDAVNPDYISHFKQVSADFHELVVKNALAPEQVIAGAFRLRDRVPQFFGSKVGTEDVAIANFSKLKKGEPITSTARSFMEPIVGIIRSVSDGSFSSPKVWSNGMIVPSVSFNIKTVDQVDRVDEIIKKKHTVTIFGLCNLAIGKEAIEHEWREVARQYVPTPTSDTLANVKGRHALFTMLGVELDTSMLDRATQGIRTLPIK